MRMLIILVCLRGDEITLQYGDVMIQTFQGSQSFRLTANDAVYHNNLRTLPATVGQCSSSFCALGNGFTLVYSDYCPVRPLIEETCNPHDRPMLVMTFGLSGHSVFHSSDGVETPFSEGRLTITSFNGSRGERRYAAGAPVGQVRLLLNAECLRHYFSESVCERLLARGEIVNHGCMPYGHATASQLTRLRQAGDDALARQIQALNLLAMQRHLLEDNPQKPLHPRDEERLEMAREWMIAHLAEPFSLSTLAMATGLSDYKLKQGFHQRFNTTPGKMLLKLRMERAHDLLEQGYQVAQAGWTVGYAHANNFSVAFNRYFGRQASAVGGKKQ